MEKSFEERTTWASGSRQAWNIPFAALVNKPTRVLGQGQSEMFLWHMQSIEQKPYDGKGFCPLS